MKRVPVQANRVVSVGYAADIQVLEVEFQNGSVYQFLEVTVELYKYLMSGGNFREEYFVEHIMDNYLCQQTYPATRWPCR